jgi:hypothetical protein
MPLFCPTSQIGFADVQAVDPKRIGYCAWGCFRILEGKGPEFYGTVRVQLFLSEACSECLIHCAVYMVRLVEPFCGLGVISA